MEFYILDDKNLNRIGIIDNPISYIWNNKFFTAGDFSIEVPETQKYISLLKKNRFLKRVDVENEIVIIETITNSKDENGNAKIIVAGTFAQSLFGRRVVWNKTLLNGNFISELRRLINENAVDPEIKNRKLASQIELISKTGSEIINENFGTPNLISISGNYEIKQVKINENEKGNIIAKQKSIIDFSKEISFQIDDSFAWHVGNLFKNPATNSIDTIEQKGNTYIKKERNHFIEDIKKYLLDVIKNDVEFAKYFSIKNGGEYFGIYVKDIISSEPFSNELVTFSSYPKDKNGIWCEEDYICIKVPNYIPKISYKESTRIFFDVKIFDSDGQKIFDSKETRNETNFYFNPYENKIIVRHLIPSNQPNIYETKDEYQCDWFFGFFTSLGLTVEIWEQNYSWKEPFYILKPDSENQIAGMIIAEKKTKEVNTNVAIKTISAFVNATKFGLYQYANVSNAIMFMSFEKEIEGSSFLKLENNPIETTQTIYEILNGENLQEYIEKFLQKNNLGLQFLLNENEKTIYVHFHSGLNRTENQKENKQIIFSKNLDNLISYEINESTQGKYNVARCYGKDNNDSEIWTQAGAGAGLSRREVFKDVSEMSDVGTADYTQALVNSGELELNGFTIAIGTEIELNNYKYRQHFNLGDIITIKINDLNLSYNIRIIEVCETFDSNGYKISLILGE